MFGNDNQGQQQDFGQQGAISPTDNNQINPFAATDNAAQGATDPSVVFPPSPQDNNDPFGTTPKTDDNSPQGSASPFGQPSHAPATSLDGKDNTTDLTEIKLQALQQLTPLVKHLDQSPEEKFKTTMMMIQATDDKSLIPDAFASAKAIDDDSMRAKALLDIVNEINYFTQNSAK